MQLRITNDEWRMTNSLRASRFLAAFAFLGWGAKTISNEPIGKWANINAITNYEWRMTNSLRASRFLAAFAFLGWGAKTISNEPISQCNYELRMANDECNLPISHYIRLASDSRKFLASVSEWLQISDS